MNKTKKVLSSALCLLLCSTLLLCGVGCSQAAPEIAKFATPDKYDRLTTTCVAENNRYSLIWNAQSKRVILYDKLKDCEWSYVPYESMNTTYDADGYDVTNHPKIESPITVEYYATSTYVSAETNAFAQVIKPNTFTLRQIENGIEMVCYFEKYAFTIPVQFVLNNDGLDISVDPSRIQEGEEYNISRISIAPFFCSVSNANVDKDGYYMFVPSGSGALIYPKYSDGIGITTSEPVYGGDQNIEYIEQTTVLENVRMPVYGAVNGNRGAVAIIKEGAESAYIETMIGQALTGYSYVTAEFRIRGYQEAVQTLFTSSVVKTNLYADAFIPGKLTVGFYPLYDDDASYVGMATKYREYLTEKGTISQEKSKDSLLNVKLVGGIGTTEFNFGIPSAAMISATTLKQAQDIVKDIKDKTGLASFNVNLVGFGSSGNDIGVVAGGYEIGSAFGDDDDFEKLNKYCEQNGLNLFMNFDMVRFNQSGGGVSETFGKADAANGSYTEKSYYTLNFRTEDSTRAKYYLVARGLLSEVASNIDEAADDMDLKGLSLDSLTSMMYSDYSEHKYFAGANYDRQVSAIINKFKNDGYKIAGSDANAYAAALCTHVYDVPTRSSLFRVFSVDVPFYEIVFKGAVSMSGTSLNLATNRTTTLLKAVESGLGLTYTLIGEYDTQLITSSQNVFYGSVYWNDIIERGVRTQLVQTVSEYKDYFESVNGAKIIGHKIITDNVRVTTFDNGVVVYVNYGDTEYSDENITVAARSYKVKEA